MNEVHNEDTFNCSKCPKTYKRIHDLHRHTQKAHQPALVPVPQYDNMASVEDPFGNPRTNNTIPTFRNTQSQTIRSKPPKIPRPLCHIATNTKPIVTYHKGTNTDPLIILTPDEVTKMQCGTHMLTYKTDFQMFMSTNNSSIAPVLQEQAIPVQAKPKDSPPNHNAEAERTARIAHKSKEINQILTNSLETKRAETSHKLASNKLKINKSATKTKKVIEKLTKQYLPFEKDIRNSPKPKSHITPVSSMSEKQTSLKVKQETTHTKEATISKPGPSLSNTKIIESNMTFQHNLTPHRGEKELEYNPTKSNITIDLTTSGTPCISIPDTNTDIGFSTESLVATGTKTKRQKMDWESILWEAYSPTRPSMTSTPGLQDTPITTTQQPYKWDTMANDESSSDSDSQDSQSGHQAEIMDKDFMSKLDELFGPISP